MIVILLIEMADGSEEGAVLGKEEAAGVSEGAGVAAGYCHSCSQSSRGSPAILLNSRVLWVTRINLLTNAIAAI